MKKGSMTSEAHVVQLPSNVTVKNATVLKETLLNGLRGHDKTILDLSLVGETDMSFFQLLCAAHKTARESGTALSLDPQGISESAQEAAKRAGLYRHVGCFSNGAGRCLWLEED